MTAFEDGLWARLVEDHDADHVSLAADHAGSSKRPLLIGGGITTLAAAAAATVAVLTAGTTQPAYALTEHPDGSITVTINDLETAVPELNARFAAMGIDETVIPVEAGCTDPAAKHFPLFADPQATGGDTMTYTPGGRPAPAGMHYVLAAEQLPNGEIATAIGAVPAPIPTCLPTTAYTLTPVGTRNGVPTFDMDPAGTSTTTSTAAITMPAATSTGTTTTTTTGN